MAYEVYLKPSVHDPLFWKRCVLVLTSAGTSTTALWLAGHGALACVAFGMCVWPYRHRVRVHAGGVELRWLLLRTTLAFRALVGASLTPLPPRSAVLTLQRHRGPPLRLVGERGQVTAAYSALLLMLGQRDASTYTSA